MSEPYLAQITLFAGNFAIRGWAYCSGQLLPISQNSAVFSLLGTTYGGDGETTFALPDLRGRVPVGAHDSGGPGLPEVSLGQRAGNNYHTLTTAHLPSHTHSMRGASEDANTDDPLATVPATTAANSYHVAADVDMGSTGPIGSGQQFSIQQPYLGLNYLIALQGLFPSN